MVRQFTFALITLVTVVVSNLALAKIKDDDFVSAISPTAPGFTIPNAHWISDEKILRSNSPLSSEHVAQLKSHHISKVLVFKAFSDPKIKEKLSSLYRANGFQKQDVKWINFPWQNIHDYHRACEQTVEALKYIKENENSGVAFHCTVGEDRTGLLAGILRQARDGWSKDKAFKEEMCARGYADGSIAKDEYAKIQIHKALTPLFDYLSSAVASKSLQWNALNSNVCDDINSRIALTKGRYHWCELHN